MIPFEAALLVFFFLYLLTLWVFYKGGQYLGYWWNELRYVKRRERKEAKNKHFSFRDVNGKQVGIEVDNDAHGAFMADVIAQTLATGKPVAGSMDMNGKVTIDVLGEDDE